MHRLAEIHDEVYGPLQSLLAVNVGPVLSIRELSNTWFQDFGLVIDLLNSATSRLTVAMVV
jgi:hypothetical protein